MMRILKTTSLSLCSFARARVIPLELLAKKQMESEPEQKVSFRRERPTAVGNFRGEVALERTIEEAKTQLSKTELEINFWIKE